MRPVAFVTRVCTFKKLTMKTLHPKADGQSHLFHLRHSFRKTVLFLLFFALVVIAFAHSVTLSFNACQLKSGTPGLSGDVYRISEDQQLGTLVLIKCRANSLNQMLEEVE